MNFNSNKPITIKFARALIESYGWSYPNDEAIEERARTVLNRTHRIVGVPCRYLAAYQAVILNRGQYTP